MNKSHALVPCQGESCDRYREGRCTCMIRVDKHMRLPVPWEKKCGDKVIEKY